MNLTAAATASAKSWTKLANALETEAAPFKGIAAYTGDLGEILLYGLPMMNADLAHAAAAKATARA